MAKLYNLARMTTTTTGSDVITLGTAVAGRLDFETAGVSDGETVSYGIVEGNNSEVGRGVYGGSGSTLTRSVLNSTNGGSPIELVGSGHVFISVLAEDRGIYTDYICIQDQKAQNTAGGTFTSGAWRTRDLNTEVADTGNHASVASNQVTLDAGTYCCLISCPAQAVNFHQARLYDTTGTAVLLIGQNAYSRSDPYYQFTHAFIEGRFTIATQKVLEVQHYSQTTFATGGFGDKCNFTTEVYTVAEFWKEA